MQNWQDIAALSVVALAVLYVARAAWLVLAKKQRPGCGTCAKCPSQSGQEESPGFVSLETLQDSGPSRAN